LPAVDDGYSDIRCDERKRQEPADVTGIDSFTPCNLVDRMGDSSGQLIEPVMAARDDLDELPVRP